MQVEKGGFFALGPTVFAQVEGQILLDGRAVFFQLEAIEFAVEIGLDQSLADAVRQFADGRADVHLTQRIAHRWCIGHAR